MYIAVVRRSPVLFGAQPVVDAYTLESRRLVQ